MGALVMVIVICGGRYASADDHAQHHHGDEPMRMIEPPRVFLDKSPRIVAYQLNRLSNERLLLVERKTDDAMYLPVYQAILSRPGMTRGDRDEALAGLVALNNTDDITELLRVLGELDTEEPRTEQVAGQLLRMLVSVPSERLQAHRDALMNAAESETSSVRAAGLAALSVSGDALAAWDLASTSTGGRIDFLTAVRQLPRSEQRNGSRNHVASLLNDAESSVQRAAVATLATIPDQADETFRLLAERIQSPGLRTEVVRALLALPREARDAGSASSLVTHLVDHAESTPADQRTTDEFIDAMQLADQLLALLPAEDARAYRRRLREVAVRVVRIHTVEEEMRYDTAYFAVEAGRDVQVVLDNEDLMPHNFVITLPGALREVAELGAEVGPTGGMSGKQYVPDSDKVLFATDMVPAHTQERLTFTAPMEPGEYPYVCTFPRHWMRMYGVMVVVEDLDAWLQNPTVPVDPIGNMRSFVQSWTIDDFQSDLPDALRGRTPDIGRKLFEEATCALCHKMQGQGGAVGPELTDVLKRWKGDHAGVLREMLDPSHKVDPKYAVHMIVTTEGLVLSGIVQAETNDAVTIIANPEKPEPTVVARRDIEEMEASSKSMMPKALLDRFTRDEILEILAYITGQAAE